MPSVDPGPCLLCRVRDRLCAIPLASVVETFRPLPVEPLASAPPFVLGLSLIRGIPTAVVDAAGLLGAGVGTPGRFVTLRISDRRVVLAVDAVAGVRTIEGERLQALPSLLRDAGRELVEAVGSLDAELLFVLRGARWLPQDLPDRGEAEGGSP
jgi:purine-binding chemotaxis protein CheW